MNEVAKRKPPLPVAQTFLTCQEILSSKRRGAALLLGPTCKVPVPRFPAHVPLAIYAEFAGGHGSYTPRLCLRDGAAEEVWGWTAAAPFEHNDPLRPKEVTINELPLAVPRPGRYTLVLLLNGEEVAQRTLWFGTEQALRSSENAV